MLSLVLLLLLQGVPVPASQAGSITGVLTTSTGKPAVGVRVSALTKPDSPLDTLTASAMASIAETDQNGVYKLENVPPGHYYIIAGRLDMSTYYPGTLDLTAGKDVLITPGAELTGMNFALKDNSAGRADSMNVNLATSWTIPIRVTVEGGGKVPIFDGGLFPVLRLTRVSDNQKIESPLTAASLSIPFGPNPEYRVTIENLTQRFTVKSIVSDKTNLLSDTLKLPPPLPPIQASGTKGATPTPVPGLPNSTIAISGNSVIFTTGNTGGGAFVVGGTITTVVPPLPPVPTIEVTLAEVPSRTPRSGATLSGPMPQPVQRSIEVSGITGTIYTDGTFELRNVPPGRHTILTRDNPGSRPVGASIIVGDQDVSDVRLQPILEIPRDLNGDIASTLTGTQGPGRIISLASVRGHLVDQASGARFDLGRAIGRITINGNTVSYTVNNTGDFEIQSLLPGRYDLELWVIGGDSYRRTLDVRDENLAIEWPVSVPD